MVSLMIFVLISFPGDTLTYNLMQRLKSPVGDVVFGALTASGGREAVVAIPLSYSFLGGEKAHRESKPMVVGGVCTGLLVTGIKFLVNRPRPDNIYTRSNSSFPSGHAAVSFYYAEYIGTYHPEMRFPLYLWAGGVAVSRLYLNRHWLSDVVVGAIIGWGMAKLTIKYGDWLKELKFYE